MPTAILSEPWYWEKKGAEKQRYLMFSLIDDRSTMPTVSEPWYWEYQRADSSCSIPTLPQIINDKSHRFFSSESAEKQQHHVLSLQPIRRVIVATVQELRNHLPQESLAVELEVEARRVGAIMFRPTIMVGTEQWSRVQSQADHPNGTTATLDISVKASAVARRHGGCV
jgi:hypothetical protein